MAKACAYSSQHCLCVIAGGEFRELTRHNHVLVFNEQSILDKLNKLNISKSPGPDGIHPRVLFELRYELLEPLYILFEI